MANSITLVPLKSDRLLVWDATCPDTFAPSHLPSATREARGSGAALNQCHIFTPVAIETAGPFGPETVSFLRDLGCRLKQVTGEVKSFSYLRQHLSIAVQRGNVAAVMRTIGGHHLLRWFLFLTAFPSLGDTEWLPFNYLTVNCVFPCYYYSC